MQSDGQTVRYRLQLDPPDAAELLGLAPDTDPDAATLEQREGRLFQRLFEYIDVRAGSAPCVPEAGAATLTEAGERLLSATFTARCPTLIDQLVVEYRLFFEIDPLHRSLVRVTYGELEVFEELAPGRNRLTWELDARPPRSQGWFLVSGVEHIVFGFDHVAFLLALLLVVVMRRSMDGEGGGGGGDDRGGWRVQALGPTLRATAALVTSFTVAHSITLVAASLGWISLDGRLVESVIAASIVYVAIENLVYPHSRHRYLLTFGFGLIHGLGFASMLAVLLPPESVVVPLLLFNLGVEVGQLGVVVVAIPALHVAARALGARRYRRWPLTVGSLLLAAAGALWLLERVFAIEVY
ncbi:MAG: hypothetical protein Tsb0020_35400 [Haliangiales bacterium]